MLSPVALIFPIQRRELPCTSFHFLVTIEIWQKLGGQKWQRTLVKDEIGIVPVPRFHQNTFEQKSCLIEVVVR